MDHEIDVMIQNVHFHVTCAYHVFFYLLFLLLRFLFLPLQCPCRWLQPDRSVDPTASDLELASTDAPLRVGSQLKYTVRTRDQDKRLVYVEGMNVSIFLCIFVYSGILHCLLSRWR